ncbi:MAG: isoprenylcysteine carboxylmethyltransferase family protein [Melioribacteraceae bacterium]|nr:isoprenylcysteine carboxylmethyltransferase family protein [Melioribacteraceae bacterium]
MDPVNLLVAVNIIATLGANVSSAKKGVKSALADVKKRPKSFLQKTPLNIAAVLILLQILGIFNLGSISNFGINVEEYQNLRAVGLLMFIVFSWLQIKSFKSLGKNYSQQVVVYKKHELVTTGFYKVIRHPQYLFQILSDLGAGIALLNYLILPTVILVLIPLLLMRAKLEEELLHDEFKDEFVEYKKKSGFFVPFIG